MTPLKSVPAPAQQLGRSFDDKVQNLAAAIGEVITDLECPSRLYNDIIDLFNGLKNDFDYLVTPEQDAAEIRRDLGRITQRIQCFEERKAKSAA
jgi:hypothetical protein